MPLLMFVTTVALSSACFTRFFVVWQPSDVATIVQHANDLGIIVLPEFEMPAHAE
jgi:N-acetyl-beta-hexosaminidase